MNFSGNIRVNKCGMCVLIGLFLLLFLYMIDVKSIVAPSSNSHEVGKISLKKLLIAGIQAAEKGGIEVKIVRSQPVVTVESKGKTKEGANDPLTNADKKSNCAMYFGLKQTFPKLKVRSEEDVSGQGCEDVSPLSFDTTDFVLSSLKDEEVSLSDVTVWIDPLDATKEFTENLLQYVTTMVCIAVQGKPVIGIIHKPFGTDPKTSWAWVDNKASFIPKPKSKPRSFIISRSHPGKVEEIVKEAFGNDAEVISAGGAGYKVLEMVAGNVTTYLHVTLIKKWDICAPSAVIQSAGGIMTTLKGNPIDFSASSSVAEKEGILVAWQTDYDELVAKFHSAF